MLKKHKELFSKHPKEFPSILKDNWDILGKIKDKNGWTLLHSMVRFFEHVSKNKSTSIRFLKKLYKHPDISKVRTSQGLTPLHQIALLKFEFCLKHPDINKVKDFKGRTPMDLFNFKLELKEKK